MRFLADMGISLRVVESLRATGHDVVHLRDFGLQKLPDHLVFSRAVAEHRILLTFDLDFGEIVARAGGTVPSMVLFRLHDTRSTRVAERLRLAIEIGEQALAEGAVILVQEGRIRIRMLPIRRGTFGAGESFPR